MISVEGAQLGMVPILAVMCEERWREIHPEAQSWAWNKGSMSKVIPSAGAYKKPFLLLEPKKENNFLHQV